MTILKMPGEVVTGPEGIQTTAVGKYFTNIINTWWELNLVFAPRK